MAGRLRWAGSEIAKAVSSLFLLVFVSFWLVRLTGNPIEIALGDRLNDAELEERIRGAGLDKPLAEQFVDYISALSRLDLGNSIFSSQPVLQSIMRSAGATFELAVPSLFFGLLFAYLIAYGTVRGSSSLIRFLHGQSAIFIYALPAFLLSVVVQSVFSAAGFDLPVSGRLSISGQLEYQSLHTKTGLVILDSLAAGHYQLTLDALAHLVLPVLVLASLTAAALTRVFALQIQDSLSRGYVIGARAKGLEESAVIRRYGVRPVISQMISISALEVAAVLTGAIYVENAFEIRGLGYLLVESVLARDYALVQGLVVALGFTIISINLIANELGRQLDPRIVTR